MDTLHIDTHVHLLVSKKQIEPDWRNISHMLHIACISGLDAICVTEHIEAVGYARLMREIFVENKLNGELYDGCVVTPGGLTLYPGAEIQLRNGTNIGVHTDLDTLFLLDHRAGAYSLAELHRELTLRGTWFILVAHHIFWPGKTYPDHAELASYVRAIEVPAKDLKNVNKYIELAERYNLATTGGSDAHTFIQIGACYGVLSQSIQASHPLLISLDQPQKNHVYSEFSKRLVEMSKLYRESLFN
ncbi:hypothetical protein OO184_02895 [Photorhabdus sp. APURE]|uniref:PHP domain-containing protein n=1 Tax=Photorhabdus aballayi TaxID=2991723 RepID=UPI00223DCCA7|nr:PHP-associated domain-containing protein [Photorhabdus aballayi]MCW7546921.1 hypothetical protein [Photorhabdus aballayi]